MKITERIDQHTHIEKSRLILYPSFPDAVKIELTSRCNLKCNFCAVKDNLRLKGDMDCRFLYQILSELKSIGVKEIGLFLLGESFILNDLSTYIKWVKKDFQFEYCFITTNGVSATSEVLKQCIESGLDSLKFSVNAPDRERYKEIQGLDVFDEIIEHIKWLHSYKKENNIEMKTALSSILIPEWKKDFDVFHTNMKQYIDETYFLPFYNLAGHIVGGTEKGNTGRIENPSKSIPCWVLFNASKITWNGWLTACYSDHDEKFKLGDLNQKTILECWYSKKAVDLRRQHLENNFRYDSLCAKCLGIEND